MTYREREGKMNNCLLTITLNRYEMNLVIAGLSVGMANVADHISEIDMMKKWGLPSNEVVRHVKKKSHTFMVSRDTVQRWFVGVLNGVAYLHLNEWEPFIQKLQNILYGDFDDMEV